MALSKVRESWRLKPSLLSRVDRKVCVCSSCSELNKTGASHLLWVCCGCQKRQFKTPLWNQQRHFGDSSPQQSEARTWKIKELKAQYEWSTRSGGNNSNILGKSFKWWYKREIWYKSSLKRSLFDLGIGATRKSKMAGHLFQDGHHG